MPLPASLTRALRENCSARAAVVGDHDHAVCDLAGHHALHAEDRRHVAAVALLHVAAGEHAEPVGSRGGEAGQAGREQNDRAEENAERQNQL